MTADGTLPVAGATGFQVALMKRCTIARDTLCVSLEKPAGFAFKAGQAIDLILLDPPETDAKGNRRAFSIVSAPHEREITVATRVRDSAFKRVLQRLAPGAKMQVEGPFGSLTLHGNRSRPAIFIAGGIGITPFVSILRQALYEALPQAMTLLYSNRSPGTLPSSPSCRSWSSGTAEPSAWCRR